ncbi:hypothetical protein DLM76_07355 [Leptospira yasudae]|nr:hypothetical protein DLM76_07355 [Leptospira yasudae]
MKDCEPRRAAFYLGDDSLERRFSFLENIRIIEFVLIKKRVASFQYVRRLSGRFFNKVDRFFSIVFRNETTTFVKKKTQEGTLS